VRDETVAASDTTLIGKDIFEGYKRAKDAAAKKGEEFRAPAPFTVKAGGLEYLVAVRPLPGEVEAQDGFYAVFSERSKAVGFAGTLRGVSKDDIKFSHFPWILVGGLFVLAIAGGLALMWLESDRPVRKLVLDAVSLGKGENGKLDEMQHRGKFGSIARSVNIAIEKLQREAKASRKDLGAVLGPAPDDGILAAGTRPLPGAVAGGGSPFAPPPPSDFSFEPPPPNPVPSAPMHLPVTPPPARPPSEAAMPKGPGFDFDVGAPPPPAPIAPPRKTAALGAGIPDLPPVAAPSLPPLTPSPPPPMPMGTPARKTQAVAAPPPPLPPAVPSPRPATPVPRNVPVPAVPALDDDILAPNLDDEILSAGEMTPPPGKGGDFGGATVVADPSEELLKATAGGEEVYFREVYEDFLELKKKCGESVESLTYEKFAAKLRGNRDQLMQKYNCKSVKFQVYVKDGKAALKATPVKA
jgi:hypothetical protein